MTGKTGVGKSCLIKRFCEDKFVSKHIATIGIDFGVNYRACPIRGIAAAAGTPELAPWICELDRGPSELLGWGLERTQTLSHGASFCDFRFTRGGSTKITPPP